jgi:hypothetical protein
MPNLDVLRVIVFWADYHREISVALANGKQIEELACGDLSKLNKYLESQREQGWKLISGLYSGQGSETFRFVRALD